MASTLNEVFTARGAAMYGAMGVKCGLGTARFSFVIKYSHELFKMSGETVLRFASIT